MLTIKKTLPTTLPYDFSSIYNLEDILFFDIETTGFSADISNLYLIGCTYYAAGSFQLIQWFADDYQSEAALLKAFFEFLKNFRLLIHYNGTTFDIPYLSKKCKQHHFAYDFSSVESLDIYKKLFPYKKVFGLDNLKQKSVEAFLQLQREDLYDGGQLIQVYVEYMKAKYLAPEKKDSLEQLLLLHNTEDLEGMLSLTSLLNYVDLFEGRIDFPSICVANLDALSFSDTCIAKNNTACDTLAVTFPLSFILPKELYIEKDHISCSILKNKVMLELPIYYGELKYFFRNFKDYFYLPEEDTAIHKSVAAYVDSAFKQKAKASNCYSKKKGAFLLQYQTAIEPFFKMNYKDKSSYVALSETFLQDSNALAAYMRAFFPAFIKQQ